MGDARLELDEQETDVEAATRPRAAHRTLWGALAVSSAVAAIAVIALVMLSRRPTSTSLRSVVFSLPPSQGTTLFPDSTAVAISPDGRVVALVTGDVAAALPPNFTGLWIRAIDSLDARFLPGTEGAAFPFWSPDSRQLAFFANRQLKKITLADGHIDDICDAPDARGGAWSPSGVIVFSPLNSGPLMRVNAAGGKPEAVTALEANEHGHRFPAFLEDGDHFVYASVPPHNGEFQHPARNRWAGLARTSLLTAQNAPSVASGHLLFMRRGSLVRPEIRSDESCARRRSGVAARRAARRWRVTPWPARRSARRATARSPTTRIRRGNSKLVWFDSIGPSAGRRGYASGDVPRRRRGAESQSGGGGAAGVARRHGVVDRRSGARRRLASGQRSRTEQPSCVFTGFRACGLFPSDRDGPRDIYVISALGSPPEQSDLPIENRWPRIRCRGRRMDGFWSTATSARRRVGICGHGRHQATAAPPRSCRGRRPKPTAPSRPTAIGWWYASDETGRYEVYVQEFPAPKRKYRVTSNGGARAWWRADSRQLLILSADWTQLLAADVRPGPVFSTRCRSRSVSCRKGSWRSTSHPMPRDSSRSSTTAATAHAPRLWC
jgi:hypothetical protein